MINPLTNEQLKFALRESQDAINFLSKKVVLLEQKNKELQSGIVRDRQDSGKPVIKPLASASRMNFA